MSQAPLRPASFTSLDMVRRHYPDPAELQLWLKRGGVIMDRLDKHKELFLYWEVSAPHGDFPQFIVESRVPSIKAPCGADFTKAVTVYENLLRDACIAVAAKALLP